MEDYPPVIFGLMKTFRVLVDRCLIFPEPVIQIWDCDIFYLRTSNQDLLDGWRQRRCVKIFLTLGLIDDMFLCLDSCKRRWQDDLAGVPS